MKATRIKLGLTAEEMEEEVFALYMRWCQSITGTTAQLQIVLANRCINAYFLCEYRKCEAEFHLRTDRYENLTEIDYMQCYTDCCVELFNRRPQALLEELKVKETTYKFNYFN